MNDRGENNKYIYVQQKLGLYFEVDHQSATILVIQTEYAPPNGINVTNEVSESSKVITNDQMKNVSKAVKNFSDKENYARINNQNTTSTSQPSPNLGRTVTVIENIQDIRVKDIEKAVKLSDGIEVGEVLNDVERNESQKLLLPDQKTRELPFIAKGDSMGDLDGDDSGATTQGIPLDDSNAPTNLLSPFDSAVKAPPPPTVFNMEDEYRGSSYHSPSPLKDYSTANQFPKQDYNSLHWVGSHDNINSTSTSTSSHNQKYSDRMNESISNPNQTKPDENNLDMQLQSSNEIKMMIESENYFGLNVKKLLKLESISSETNELALRRLLDRLETTYSQLISSSSSSERDWRVDYFDQDVDDYVSLDAHSWTEFIKQSKKLIKIIPVHRSTHYPSMPTNPPPPIPTLPPPPIPTMILPPVDQSKSTTEVDQTAHGNISNTTSNIANDPLLQLVPSLINQLSYQYTQLLSTPSMSHHDHLDPYTVLNGNVISIHHSDIPTLLLNHQYHLQTTYQRRYSTFDRPDRPTLEPIPLLFSPPNRSHCKTNHPTIWKLTHSVPQISSEVVKVNGVVLTGLHKDYQFPLVNQRCRPIIFEFRSKSLPKSLVPMIKLEEKVEMKKDSTNTTTTHRKANEDVEIILPPVSIIGNDVGLDEVSLLDPKQLIDDGQPLKLLDDPPTDDFISESQPTIPTVPEPDEIKSKNQLNYSQFYKKFQSNLFNKIRKKILKILHEYCQCNWQQAKREGTGTPQATLTSMYKYTEQEMIKMGLFNNKKSTGNGIPDMTDENKQKLKNFIEQMIFNYVKMDTEKCWLIYRHDFTITFDEEYDGKDFIQQMNQHFLTHPNRKSEQKNIFQDVIPKTLQLHKNLSMKLSFLQFITLEHLGLKVMSKLSTSLINQNKLKKPVKEMKHRNPEQYNDDDGEEGEDYSRSQYHIEDGLNEILMKKEEWYVAMKGLLTATSFTTPGDILSHLVEVMKLVSHALDALINSAEDVNSTIECSACGQLHVMDEVQNQIICKETKLVVAQEVVNPSMDRNHYTLQQRICIPSLPQTTRQYNRMGTSTVFIPSDHVKDILEDGEPIVETPKQKTDLSADDMIPAIIWLLIQCNPPNIEYIVWMCGEFRHPDLLNGEEAYYLAQLSSAVEFCRSATRSSFDISPLSYHYQMHRYHYTLQLLLACKDGQLSTVKYLVECVGADVNGMSPDCKDIPLTASIRFKTFPILRYLLSNPHIQIDKPVQLFHAAHQRSTALLIAVRKNFLSMIIALLNAGADRYVEDDDHQSAFTIAAEKGYHPAFIVLQSDPFKHDLIDVIRAGNDRIIWGLLLQKVQINYLEPREGVLTPLIAAVMEENIDVVRTLVYHQTIDLDLKNSFGDTALGVCIKLFVNQPTLPLVLIASILLRFGANRHHAMSILSPPPPLGEDIDIIRWTDNVTIATYYQLCYQHWALHYKPIQIIPPLIKTDVRKEMTIEAFHEEDDRPSDVIDTKQIEKEFEWKTLMSCLFNYSVSSHPIHTLAKERNTIAVKALIYQGADVNAPDPRKKFTPLISAVYHNDIDMVDTLLQADDLQRITDARSKAYSPNRILHSYIHESLHSLSEDTLEDIETNHEDRPDRPSDEEMNYKIDLNKEGRDGMTPLHYAAQIGNVTVVGKLLQAGASRSLMNDKKQSPLDVAIANGHVEAANALRFDPVNVSICLAAKHGDWIVMRALMVQGVSINTQRQHMSTQGFHHELFTPLIAAAAHGQFDTLCRILDVEDIMVNLPNLQGQTALMFSAARGEENAVLRLLKKGANRYLEDTNGQDAATSAEKRGHPHVATLLRHDPKLVYVHDIIRRTTVNDITPVVSMFKQGVDINQVRLYIDSPNPNEAQKWSKSQTTPRAITSSSSGLSLFPSVSRVGSKSSKGSSDTLNSKEARGDVAVGETPLIVAAQCNRVDVIKLLLKAPGIRINQADKLGMTALMHAAKKGHEAAVLALLSGRAGRRVPDKIGRTASEIANIEGKQFMAALIDADPYVVHIHDMCEVGQILMVTALIKQGCPPNYQDERPGKQLQTPLMAAASGRKIDVVRMLLRLAAVQEGKDQQDALGRTALMRAAAVGALDITAAVLNAGCDRNLKDKAGMNAIDHASKHGMSTMLQYFSQTMIR